MIRALLAFILLSYAAHAQKVLDPHQLIQFSGVVVTADSLKPIPFSSVMIKNTNRGTVSDYYGFFSFVAKMKDTIEFAAIGYKRAIFIIPDTLTDQRCSMIQMLKPDTILLREVVIFPWPTKEQFKEAFLQLRIPDDDLSRAERNLDPNQLSYLAASMPMDGSMNFRNAMEQHTATLYYNGQLPPINLLNPVKWAQFIQMWQSGAFRKKDGKFKDEN
jgi:hypothetical protein